MSLINFTTKHKTIHTIYGELTEMVKIGFPTSINNGDRKIQTSPVVSCMVQSDGKVWLETKNTGYIIAPLTKQSGAINRNCVPQGNESVSIGKDFSQKKTRHISGRLVSPVSIGKPAIIEGSGEIIRTSPVLHSTEYPDNRVYLETQNSLYWVAAKL